MCTKLLDSKREDQQWILNETISMKIKFGQYFGLLTGITHKEFMGITLVTMRSFQSTPYWIDLISSRKMDHRI